MPIKITFRDKKKFFTAGLVNSGKPKTGRYS